MSGPLLGLFWGVFCDEDGVSSLFVFERFLDAPWSRLQSLLGLLGAVFAGLVFQNLGKKTNSILKMYVFLLS